MNNEKKESLKVENKVIVKLSKNLSKSGLPYVSLDFELDYNSFRDNNLDLSAYNYILLSSGMKKDDLEKVKTSYRFNVPYTYVKGVSKNNKVYYGVDLKIGLYKTRLFLSFIQLENIKLNGIDLDSVCEIVEIKDFDDSVSDL